MIRRHPLLRCLLLLMLAAGPLQAQTVFLCEMMDVPPQETCCCEEPEAAAREAEAIGGCNGPPCRPPPPEAEGCCDSAVEVSYEPEAGPSFSTPPTDRDRPELPAAAFVACELPLPPEPPARAVTAAPHPVRLPDGSNLYLRTERLRI